MSLFEAVFGIRQEVIIGSVEKPMAMINPRGFMKGDGRLDDWSKDPNVGSVDLTWLIRADEIAAEAHAGQLDKGGAPYIEHPRRVSAAVSTIPEKIVALLHDVVEDCPGWTFDRLRAEGFADDIIEAVDAMTKRRGEDYFAAILRARANTIARQVKLADLADNSDHTAQGDRGAGGEAP